MTCTGVVRGNTIELDRPLPYEQGQPVTVWVEPSPSRRGSPSAIREAMHRSPRARPEDVDELERVIEAGKLPVRYESIFDDGA